MKVLEHKCHTAIKILEENLFKLAASEKEDVENAIRILKFTKIDEPETINIDSGNPGTDRES